MRVRVSLWCAPPYLKPWLRLGGLDYSDLETGSTRSDNNNVHCEARSCLIMLRERGSCILFWSLLFLFISQSELHFYERNIKSILLYYRPRAYNSFYLSFIGNLYTNRRCYCDFLFIFWAFIFKIWNRIIVQTLRCYGCSTSVPCMP